MLRIYFLIFLSAFPLLSMGQVTEGLWTYIVENGGVTITASTATGAVTFPSELGGYPVKKVGNQWPSIFGNGSTSVTSVVIPDSVTSIGDGAFSGCTSLASVTVGNSVTSIGSSAFNCCTGLTSITIPNSVTSIGYYAFCYCTRLTSVTIPNSVTSIGSGAFTGCTKLESVTFEPNSSVTLIEAGVFSDCTSLTSITIPNSVTSIAGEVINPYSPPGIVIIPLSTFNPTIFIIQRGAFSGCTSLASVTVGNSVTSIGSGAFTGCTSLTSITLVDGLPAIGSGWFAGIPVTSIIIPNSVTSIGSSAFNGCTGLTSITIPSSVTSIGEYAFNGCTGLTSVTMPVSYIGQTTQIGISGQVASDYIINALANNDAFVTAVANKIKATSGNYGLATQSGVTGSISSVINEGKVAGIASLIASPNTWSLFTTSQIQNMAIGDLVLTREVNGNFVLNYDIEQSDDMANWTVYSANRQIVKLPADKAFVRIKAKQ